MFLPHPLLALATAQGGLFAFADAQHVGVSERQLQYRVRSGALSSPVAGVYRVGIGEQTAEAHVRQALLAQGPDAVVSHNSALHLYGCDVGLLPAELTRPYGKGARASSGIVHRSRIWEPTHFTVAQGFPATTPARTLIDLSGRESIRTLGSHFDVMTSAGCLTPAELTACAVRFPLRAYGRKIANIWKMVGTRDEQFGDTESVLEELALDLIKRAGLPLPVLQYPMTLEGRSIRIDMAWIEERVAAEIDGYGFHRTASQFDADHDRDVRLIRANWKPLRFSAPQLRTDLVRTLLTVL